MPKELPSRRFWFATAATATLVVGATVVAGAAVLDLPVLGFGQHADASESNTTQTTKVHKVEPVPVEQIQFDDHFVRRGPSANEGPGSAPSANEGPDDQNGNVDTLPDREDDHGGEHDGDDDGEDHEDEGEHEDGHEIGDDD